MRQQSLARMELIIPWRNLCAVIKPRGLGLLRATLEHQFLALRRGLDKSVSRLVVACGLYNLYLVQGLLLRQNCGHVLR